MDHLEKVEKLRQRADVSYEEAKKALEECDWDMLDALVKLETQGKVKDVPKQESGQEGSADTAQGSQPAHPLTVCGTEESGRQDENKKQSRGKQGDNFFTKLGRAIKYLVKKGCDNSLVIKQHGQPLMDLPVIAFIILLILFFWVVVPIMVISLFFDFSYNFKGADLGKEQVNRAMDSATEAVNNFKSEIKKDDR
ncbi:DUF4342 domain-containing protein [Anaerovorax odorimutans]|uniref:DUF4342 domain-containing protein n=1 Tax=Anaerovorax odorimutans TaxID=109327 RepID=A0ABT1RN15_9FIRM|nr:DUF4342 domain-containing protein [Anaerovorax odorimutans]MCQ4636563.1 DUF4342 domain-containing protein [Anaerovorax odorimutans]